MAELDKLDTHMNPEIHLLRKRKGQIEDSIRQLKNEKGTLSEADYSRQLENLLIQLAQTNQKLRQAEKKDRP